ncbi:MAG: acyl-CoA dehydrogenase domain-containing protein, partial [Methylobacter sp.]
LADSPVRERLTHGIYINSKADDATGRIEAAFKAVLAAAPVETKIHIAQKQKLLSKADQSTAIADALSQNIITQQEADLMAAAEQARLAAITVDDFSPEELAGNRQQLS